ncbi:hypothetical protein G6F44_004971 [Rhizopus delemar]|nr:hypothetical protein G6F44_004971 [Rhizopus delemar]
MDYQTIIKKIDRKSITILSSAVMAVVVTWMIKRAIKKSKEPKTAGLKDIPTPKGEYFYIGHLPLFGKYPSFKVTEWHRELGPLFRIKMGVQDWVFIGDPEMAHELFMSKGSVTSGRPFFTYGTGYHGQGERGIVFTDYGKPWKNTRTAALDVLSPNTVDILQETIARETGNGVELMIKDAFEAQEKNESINPLAYTRLTAMSIILATVFGIDGAKSVEDPLYKRIISGMEENAHYISLVGDLSAYFPVLSFLDVLFRKERKMKNFVENSSRPLYRHLVQLARLSDRPSLVKNLDEIKDSLKIDEQNIVALTNELMIGGIDTVSNSMAWAFAILCHHPDWQKKMSDEIDSFVHKHGRLPMFTERKEIPSLIAVIKETLRYRPSIYFGVPHKATKDVVYKDYVIPKGTILISNAHTTNNDPRLFSEPEKFKPERYLDDPKSLYASSNGSIQNRELFTFGWGRRICPGIYMAESEMFNWMAQFFQRCTIEPFISSTGEKIYPNLDDCVDKASTIAPLPYKVRLIKRHDTQL